MGDESNREHKEGDCSANAQPRTAQTEAASVEPLEGGSSAAVEVKQEHKAAIDSDKSCHNKPISNQTLVDRINRSDRWMIGLTAVIALGGIVSACIFGQQLTAMQGQLDEMKKQRRPWVSLKPEDGLAISSPLTFNPKIGADLRITYKLRNTGQSPALGARFRAKIVTLPEATFSTVEIAQKENEFCDPLRKQTSQFYDDTIFPGDTVPGDDPAELIQSEIEKFLIKRLSRNAHPGFISMYLISCIDYQMAPIGGDHYQTRYAFILGVPQPNGAIMADIKPDPGVRPDVRLVYFSQSAE